MCTENAIYSRKICDALRGSFEDLPAKKEKH